MAKGNPNPDTFARKADRAAWLKLFTDEAMRAGAAFVHVACLPKGCFRVTVDACCAASSDTYATISFDVVGGTHAPSILGAWNVYGPCRFSKAMEALGPVNSFHRQKATRVLRAAWATHGLTADIRMIRDGSAFEGSK